jgi:hypothetical protein
MSNPYHDAQGHFCSRDEMKAALDQYVTSNDMDGYLTFREAFDAADQDNKDDNSISTKRMSGTTETEHTVNIPNTFGSWTIMKGQLNEKTNIALTSGICANVAQQLHKKTGWPYVAAVNKNYFPTKKSFKENWREYYDSYDSGLTHIMLKHPSGKLVDPYGARTNEEYLQETEPYWGKTLLTPVSAEFVEKHTIDNINPDHLESFMQPIIDLANSDQRLPNSGYYE